MIVVVMMMTGFYDDMERDRSEDEERNRSRDGVKDRDGDTDR
jgi:hypothetical protein